MAIAMLRVVRTIRRPTNWKTILALVASVTAVVRTPRTFTQTWGVWVFAFGVCAALGVYRWHVLLRERRGENRGIDARDRMKLVAGATRFRQGMLRADARCEQRSGREVLVAADVLAIYEFPFQLSTAESTPFVDAYFGLHDQAAAIIIGRQASSAMRDDLRRQRALTRDRGFRHAIDLALER